MTVKLRLARSGRKKLPFYHVVATDERNPRDGRFLEKLGYYNPNVKEDRLTWKADRVTHWLNLGAQPSERVSKFILAEGLGTEKQRATFEKRIKERVDAVQKRLAEEKVKAEAEAKAAAAGETPEAAPTEGEEAPAEEVKAEEKPAEEVKEEPKAEETKEEVKAEAAEEAPAEEKKAEAPAEEAKEEKAEKTAE